MQIRMQNLTAKMRSFLRSAHGNVAMMFAHCADAAHDRARQPALILPAA